MRLIAQKETANGQYRIVDQTYDGRPARILYAGRATPQSGVALDDEPELLFDYVQRMFEIVLSVKAKNILILGGGAFCLPTAIIERTAVRRVDVVEIDNDLIDVAREYFAAPFDDPRLHVYSMDAAHFLATTRRTYDLILVDVFSEYDIPDTLMSRDAGWSYAAHLTRRGLLAMNYIGYVHGKRARDTKTLVANFSEALSETALFPADSDDDVRQDMNLLVVASRRPLPDFLYLQSSSIQFSD